MSTQFTVLASGGGSMVDIDATILIQLVIFLFMLVVLRKLLFQPVIRLIEARREATEGALAAAEELDKEADALNTQFNEKMVAVRASATTERDRLIEEARTKERKVAGKSRDEAHDIILKMRADTERIAEETRDKLSQDIADIAEMVAAKTLNRAL